jgi:hypothetical protein
MVRPKNEIRSHFGGPYRIGGVSKSRYCNCKACDDAMIAASSRLQDHWGNVISTLEQLGNWMPALCHTMPERSRRKQLAMTCPPSMLTTVPLRSHSIRLDQVLLLVSFLCLQAQQGLGAFSPSDNTVVELDDSTCGGQHSSFFSGGRQHFDLLKRRRERSLRCSIRPFWASHSQPVQCF